MIVNMNGLQMVLPYKTIYSCRVSVVVSVNCCIIYIYMLCFFFFCIIGQNVRRLSNFMYCILGPFSKRHNLRERTLTEFNVLHPFWFGCCFDKCCLQFSSMYVVDVCVPTQLNDFSWSQPTVAAAAAQEPNLLYFTSPHIFIVFLCTLSNLHLNFRHLHHSHFGFGSVASTQQPIVFYGYHKNELTTCLAALA